MCYRKGEPYLLSTVWFQQKIHMLHMPKLSQLVGAPNRITTSTSYRALCPFAYLSCLDLARSPALDVGNFKWGDAFKADRIRPTQPCISGTGWSSVQLYCISSAHYSTAL